MRKKIKNFESWLAEDTFAAVGVAPEGNLGGTMGNPVPPTSTSTGSGDAWPSLGAPSSLAKVPKAKKTKKTKGKWFSRKEKDVLKNSLQQESVKRYEVYGYKEFLDEREITVPTATTSVKVVTTMIDSAKREKLIKSAKMLSYYDDQQPGQRAVELSAANALRTEYFYVFTTLSNQNFHVTFSGGRMNLGESFNVLVWSQEPFALKDIEDAIVEKARATYRNVIHTYERKTVHDFSTKPGNLVTVAHSNKYSSSYFGPSEISAYYMVFNYKSTISRGDAVTFDMAKKTKAFEDLMKALPLKVVSTPKQIKNATIIFAIPASHVVDPEKTNTKDGYFRWGYGLTASGYIRRFFFGSESQMIGKFDSTSLKEWERAFGTIQKLFEKDIEALKQRDVRIVSTPEEREKYRGMITGYDFGV